MASIDKLLISNPEERQWVYDIDEILNHMFQTEVHEPRSISLFQVPDTLTQKKPEAYEPQRIGLGPIHHFRPRPYKKMEQKKLDIMRKVIKGEDIKKHVLNKVGQLVPMIRSCYDMFLQQNDYALAMTFAIDGLFLLNLFHTYNYNRRLHHQSDPQDMLMVENQIPFMVLQEIDDALHPSASRNFSPSIFRTFCEVHSPLNLCSKSQAPSSADHLLHYMYNSILNNVPETKPDDDQGITITLCNSVTNFLKFAENAPKDEIVQAYVQTVSFLETFSQSKTPSIIPSASELRDNASFEFKSDEAGGVGSIRITSEKAVYLPVITLNNNSDVILRNLIAYETLAANSDSPPLNEYMGLMCGLIKSKDDANYLKTQKVIAGDMSADEVAKLFIEMSSCVPTTFKTKHKSKLQTEVIDKINEVYESGVRIKTADLLLKKVARWILKVLKATGSFVESSWKIVAFMVSILTVFMLTSQAYCDVYGCGKKTVTLLPYASG